MRIAYKVVNGVASDIRCVSDAYQAATDERVIEGDALPDADSLSNGAVIVARRERELAMAAVATAEVRQQRALRELILSVIAPGSVDAATVEEAKQRLTQVEAEIRANREKLK